MKIILLSLCLFMAVISGAQTVQTYYDWQWKPCEPEKARFISQVTRTDSGWLRRDFFLSTKTLQMKGLYKDSVCKIRNGWFRQYYVNEKLHSYGLYVNGKRDGTWLNFYNNGMMRDSIVYDLGVPKTITAWHSNGYISDSSVYGGDEGVHAYWFNNGVSSHTGRSFKEHQEGKWQYFHKNGKLAALEDYGQGKLKSRIYYDEEGKELTGTASKDRSAEFAGGSKKWKSFMLENLEFPRGVKLVNTDVITVVIAATIDEDGKLSEAYVDVPFNKLFDEEALRVMKSSPKWNPSISHNRRVRHSIRQPISFLQQ